MTDLPVFDEYTTGKVNPESGLYLCEGCNEIIPLSKREKFPPCATCDGTTWKMVAVAGEAGRTYGTGKNSPESGLFICSRCRSQVIPISEGDNFPPCASCRAGTEWQAIVYA